MKSITALYILTLSLSSYAQDPLTSRHCFEISPAIGKHATLNEFKIEGADTLAVIYHHYDGGFERIFFQKYGARKNSTLGPAFYSDLLTSPRSRLANIEYNHQTYMHYEYSAGKRSLKIGRKKYQLNAIKESACQF